MTALTFAPTAGLTLAFCLGGAWALLAAALYLINRR